MLLPLWQEIEELLTGSGMTLIEANEEINNYHLTALYSLDKIEKEKNLSLNLNSYKVDISLTLVTKTSETTANHNQLVLNLLYKIEMFDADLFVSLEQSPPLIIDGSEYRATRFELTTQTLHLEELL